MSREYEHLQRLWCTVLRYTSSTRHKHRHCQNRKKRLRDEGDITENDAFRKLVKRAQRGNDEEYNEKVTSLVNGGMSKSTSICKIDKQLVFKDADAFIESY